MDKLRDRIRSRLRRLTLKGTAHTPTDRSTITDSRSHGLTLLSTLGSPSVESQQAAPTGESMDITTLPYLFQDLQDILIKARNISAPTEASQQPSHGCTHCEARFVSEYGLHMHITRMHRDKLTDIYRETSTALCTRRTACLSARLAARNSSNRRVCAITCSPGPAPDRISYDPSPPHLKHRFRVKL